MKKITHPLLFLILLLSLSGLSFADPRTYPEHHTRQIIASFSTPFLFVLLLAAAIMVYLGKRKTKEAKTFLYGKLLPLIIGFSLLNLILLIWLAIP